MATLSQNDVTNANTLTDIVGFNTIILLPAPAHLSYCAVGGRCALTAQQIAAGVDAFRDAGWRVILYTSFMHVGEARIWTNGSINAQHPQWAQRNSSGAAWHFEGANSPLSPCSESVINYTIEYAVAQATAMHHPDAIMLDNNEMGPMAWGCSSSGCGYETACAAAFDSYIRSRFNKKQLQDCFGVAEVEPVKPPPRETVGSPLYGLWVHFRNIAMRSLNDRFGTHLRHNGHRLLANTAINWPDFSLAQDLQYAAEDVVLSEVYDTDPLALHGSLSLGIGLAQGRAYWSALYQNEMRAVELPPGILERVLIFTAAHQGRPWLVFENVLLNQSDVRAETLKRVQSWLSQESLFLQGGSLAAPVACMASAATRNSVWHNATNNVAIVPRRCLQRAAV
eukprot:SAG31_NODE_1978_length_6749_cov_5.971579_2_plen_395_part_00